MGKSIVKNYIYNLLLTILNIIFPLITFPYISRILGATGVGKINFANSLVNYFVLFAALGIPVYAVREISKVRESRKEASKVFSEIFIINFVSTTIFSIVYYTTIFFLPYFEEDLLLYSIMGLLIIFNYIGIDWLYQGFEDYKYITIRSLIMKSLSIVAIFFLVSNKSDYVMYGLISVIAISGSNVLNIFRVKKYVEFTIKDLRFKRHFKQVLFIFFMGVSINIYNNLDSTMLGFMSGDVYVGYYSVAIKINRIALTIVTSLGVVLLPRLSYYIEKKNYEAYNEIIKKSIDFIFVIALPMCTGLILLAPSIINVFSGSEFANAIPTMIINVPLILFGAITNLTSLQILLPLKKEKENAISVTVAALSNFSLNLILIPSMQANGAALASTLAYLVDLCVQLYFCKKYMGIKLLRRKHLIYAAGCLLITGIVLGLKIVIKNDFLLVFVSAAISSMVYFIWIFLLDRDMAKLVLKKES